MGRKSRVQRVNYSVLNTEGFGMTENEVDDLQQYVISPLKKRAMKKSEKACKPSSVDEVVNSRVKSHSQLLTDPAAEEFVVAGVVEEECELGRLEASNVALKQKIAELLEEKRKGDLVKNDCVVVNTQRCPNNGIPRNNHSTLNQNKSTPSSNNGTP